MAGLLAERGLVPIVDFAYQGLGDGLIEDAEAIRCLTRHCGELMVASSCSKNFGLYNERLGALTAVTKEPETHGVLASQLKRTIRTNYSNPPAHGARIVNTVLSDVGLRDQWEGELTALRERIHGMRRRFADTLRECGAPRDFSFIASQHGMFSYTGLTTDQVAALRERHAIYIVGSGRINVAGLNEHNLQRIARAVVDVLN